MDCNRTVFALGLAAMLAGLVPACTERPTPEQEQIIESLNQRDPPAWFDESKLGIFIHWGPYAVPAFAPTEGSINDVLTWYYDDFLLHLPYVEWYWNALQYEESATHAYHVEKYGADYPYEEFGRTFKLGVQSWDPQEWADLFYSSGAVYVVLVTKHHDGFLMWPSAHTNPNKENWYSERDIVGELAQAVRARGMRFGVYYSGGLDWAWNVRSSRNVMEMVAAMPVDAGYRQYAEAHFRELIDRYQPSVLWNDIGYASNKGLWELQRDYYAAVRDGLVNDRFGVLGPFVCWLRIPAVSRALNKLLKWYLDLTGSVFSELPLMPPPHYDFRTPEYAQIGEISQEKFELTRGMGLGFGYNQFEPDSAVMSEEELIHGFVDAVSKNGNLLLNVGPKSNGDIPDIQATRLRQLGAWLSVNGAAIYRTRPWVRAEGETQSGEAIRFTQNEDILFAIVLNHPTPGSVRLLNVQPESLSSVELLGYGPVTWTLDGRDILVELPEAGAMGVAYTLALHR